MVIVMIVVVVIEVLSSNLSQRTGYPDSWFLPVTNVIARIVSSLDHYFFLLNSFQVVID
jgi:hypothetical protein